MKKHIWHMVVLIIIFALAGVAAGFWWQKNESAALAAAVVSSGILSENDLELISIAQFPEASATTSELSSYFAPGAPLQWKEIVAENTIGVPADLLAFTLGGQPVSVYLHGESYYLVDKAAYQNFRPRNLADLVLLQFPDVPLTTVGENGAWVQAASAWFVPENIPGEFEYAVHYLSSEHAPAGSLVRGNFTVWIVAAK
jgi:hypothetical protein